MLISVTGSTGFIGQYIVKRLLADGHTVRAFVRKGRSKVLIDQNFPGTAERLQFHEGDLTDKESVSGFLKDANFLVHLASAHDHLGDEVMQRVNVAGTEYLVADAEENAAENFQFINVSSAVIGVPVYSYYRDSKRVQEKIVRGSSLRWASFRPTLVYGRGDYRHTAPLLRKCGADSGSYWIYHEGISKLNPVHVDDVVEAIVRAFDYDRGKEDFRIFEIAGPEGISFNDFVDLTIAATGGSVRRRNIPRRWVERAILFKGLFRDVTKERRGAGYFSLHHDHDITAAREELKWEPRHYSQGVKDITQDDWWREDNAGTGHTANLGI
ncbi:MAG: nucleoside-diphosphate-sugar epimerase [Planctomycetota bacterium]|jgi:nucleoside-diphosphate-sugar epimerase